MPCASNSVMVASGQMGVQCADRFWRGLLQEHDMNENGRVSEKSEDYSLMVHFSEHHDGSHSPRCLYIDTENCPIECLRSGSTKNLYDARNFECGKESAAGNWARGFHNKNWLSMVQSCRDKYRALQEECDSQSSVFRVGAISGGTGSGFADRVFSESMISPKLFSLNITLNPSGNYCTNVTSHYNSVLCWQQCYDQMNAHTLFENEMLYKRAFTEGITDSSYVNLNDIISQLISAFTCCMRFENTLGGLPQMLGTNLIPFQNMKLLVTSCSALGSVFKPINYAIGVNQITCQLFKTKNSLFSEPWDDGVFLGTNIQYRGRVPLSLVHGCLTKAHEVYKPKFAEWGCVNDSLTGFKISNCWKQTMFPKDSVFQGNQRSCSMLTNTTVVAFQLEKLKKKFARLQDKRAFIFWYVGEGMEEGELDEAKEYLTSITESYKFSGGYTKGE